ncbi:unnamed protein product [Urochloa humidicola]
MGWAARFLTVVSFLAAGALFAPDALRLGSSGVGEADPPPRLRHRVGRRALGHLYRRHRHVQALAKTPVWELAGKDVPDVLHVDISEFRTSAISAAALAYLHPWKTASTIEPA